MDHQTNRDSRRKFLKKAGKFAVYTPPALLLMSKSSHVAFAQSWNGNIDNNTTDNNNGDSQHSGYTCGSGLLGRLFCNWF